MDRKLKAVKMEESDEESEDSDETSDEEMDEEAIARRRELMRQRAQAKAQLGVVQVSLTFTYAAYLPTYQYGGTVSTVAYGTTEVLCMLLQQKLCKF